MIKKCLECGDELTSKKKKYCSQKCKNKYHYKKKIKDYQEVKTCIQCGKEFKPKKQTTETCCLICYEKNYYKKSCEKKKEAAFANNAYTILVYKNCSICGKLFIADRSNRKTCGDDFCKIENSKKTDKEYRRSFRNEVNEKQREYYEKNKERIKKYGNKRVKITKKKRSNLGRELLITNLNHSGDLI